MGRDKEGSDEVAVGIEWEAVLVQSVSGIFGYAGHGFKAEFLPHTRMQGHSGHIVQYRVELWWQVWASGSRK
jgi:hypothetical protein